MHRDTRFLSECSWSCELPVWLQPFLYLVQFFFAIRDLSVKLPSLEPPGGLKLLLIRIKQLFAKHLASSCIDYILPNCIEYA